MGVSQAKKEEWTCAPKWKSAGMDGLVSNWCDSDEVKKALLKKKEERGGGKGIGIFEVGLGVQERFFARLIVV